MTTPLPACVVMFLSPACMGARARVYKATMPGCGRVVCPLVGLLCLYGALIVVKGW